MSDFMSNYKEITLAQKTMMSADVTVQYIDHNNDR